MNYVSAAAVHTAITPTADALVVHLYPPTEVSAYQVENWAKCLLTTLVRGSYRAGTSTLASLCPGFFTTLTPCVCSFAGHSVRQRHDPHAQQRYAQAGGGVLSAGSGCVHTWRSMRLHCTHTSIPALLTDQPPPPHTWEPVSSTACLAAYFHARECITNERDDFGIV